MTDATDTRIILTPNGTKDRVPIGAQPISRLTDTEVFAWELVRAEDIRVASEQQARHNRFAAALSRRLGAEGIDVPPEALTVDFSTGNIIGRRELARHSFSGVMAND